MNASFSRLRPIVLIPVLLVALGFLCIAVAQADIIPEDMKVVHVSGFIENLDEYSGYVFVQYETLGDEVRKVEVIRAGHGITPGYKLNRMRILAVPKAVFESRGGIDGLDVADPAILRSKPLDIGRPELVRRDSPVSTRDDYYRIVLTSDKVLLNKIGQQEQLEQASGAHVNGVGTAFLITVSIELIVFILLLRIGFRSREPATGRIVLSVVVAQAATLPILWGAIVHFGLVGTGVTLAAEGFAIGGESVIYHYLARLNWRRAFIASLTCNAMSFLAGVVV